ncbi:uncharacterized protein LAESUDRAFT_714291 [Laetiporus sulphureus 93-53]|uniref:RNase III domain-containing protein n=1 Tax=Laetiporus sulphureus 93-53 TaxID=1314785 RepID=A0A165EA53_9APHY|nr:uncharacterized protein LAESUDRAFT_714291 [Laetiporus sulphureus 93-53]KZT06570.1 hypothetical protein LAESUDRAFT_714291 [Laetiporus sulphureus 93-53]
MYTTIELRSQVLISQCIAGDILCTRNFMLHCTNITFSHIAEKLAMGCITIDPSITKAMELQRGAAASTSKPKPKIKAVADLFETVIEVYYLEDGFEALCTPVQELYKPLIEPLIWTHEKILASPMLEQAHAELLVMNSLSMELGSIDLIEDLNPSSRIHPTMLVKDDADEDHNVQDHHIPDIPQEQYMDFDEFLIINATSCMKKVLNFAHVSSYSAHE